jgi:FecR protein
MREYRGLGWLCLVLALQISGAAASEEPQIGVVIQREFNGAAGKRVRLPQAEDLPYAREVFAGEKVNTPDNSSTVLRFRDQTQLQVGANSSLVLDRFIYDPNAQAMEGTITLVKGIFRYVSRSAANDQRVKLTTPTTTMSIRGTTFVVYVAKDGSTTLAVVDGQVDVKPCAGTNTPRIKAGMGLNVSPSCAMTDALLSMPDDPAVASDYSVDIGDRSVGKGGTVSSATSHAPAAPDHEPDGPGQ